MKAQKQVSKGDLEKHKQKNPLKISPWTEITKHVK